jgi:multiple sugar transport system permease protein
MVFSLILSFTEWNFLSGFRNIKFIGLDNFINMWGNIWFTDSMRNTLYYTVLYVPITMAFSFLLAVFLNEYVFFEKFLRLCYFIPYISSIAATSILWKVLYAPSGPISGFFAGLGITAPNFLADVHWAMPAVVLISVWSTGGYCALIYVAGMEGIPRDIYESAELDGVNKFIRTFQITLPMLSKTSFFLLITQMINSFKVFGQIQIMTHGGPIRSTSVLAYYIYQSAFVDYRFGFASAMAMILFIIILVFTLLQWKIQDRYDF